MKRHFTTLSLFILLGSIMLAGLLAGYSSLFEQGQAPTWTATPPITPINTQSSQTALIALNYDKTRWLKGIPCKLPCWENIIPGKTDVTEATRLLKANPAVNNIINDGNYLTVSWKTPGLPGMLYFDSAKIITRVELGLDFYEFKDVRAALGEPDFVVAEQNLKKGTPSPSNTFGYENVYNVTLIWEKAGVLFRTRPDDTEKPQFDQKLLLRGPVIVANDGKTLEQLLHNRKDYVVKWQSGGTFETFCRYSNSNQQDKIVPCFK
jgi:hypothetical protein